MKTKTTLTIEVEYDDTKTDPQALTVILDKAVENGFIVMEDAGVADCGKPIFKDARVEDPVHAVIEVAGGCCTDAYLAKGDNREFSYTIVDHDTEDDEDEEEETSRSSPPGGGLPTDE